MRCNFFHLFLTTFLSCIISEVSCQEFLGNQKKLQFSFGATHYRLIDELLAQKKVKFSGTLFTSQIQYRQNTPKYIITGTFKYGQGRLNNKPSGIKAELYDLRMSASYQRHISDLSILNKKSAFFIGAQVGFFGYIVGNEEIIENFATTFNNLVDILLTQKIALSNSHKITWSLTLPIVGFVKRQAFDGGINQTLPNDFKDNFFRFLFGNSKAIFINPLNLARINTSYIFNNNRNVNFVINYEFHFLKNTLKLPVISYGNHLSVGVRFGLKSKKNKS